MHLRNDKLKKAITYTWNYEEFLMTYLEDGRCSMSNNQSENSIRPVTVGRTGCSLIHWMEHSVIPYI